MRIATVFVAVFAFGLATAHARPEFKCAKKSLIKEAIQGKLGTYEVKQGLNVSKNEGFVDRKTIKLVDGCFVPDLKTNDCVVLHVDKAAFDKLSPRGQCVFADNGKPLTSGAITWSGDAVRAKDIMLKCPGTADYKCLPGSNSERASALEDELKKKGLKLWSMCAPYALNSFDERNNKKIFYQLYDEKTDQVLFATEFLVTESK